MQSVLVSYSKVEHYLAPSYAMLLVAIGLTALFFRFRARTFRRGDSFLFSAAVMSIVCLLVPHQLFGGSHLFSRLLIFPVLMLLAWLSTVEWTVNQRTLIRCAGVAVSLAFLGSLGVARMELQPYFREFEYVGKSLSPDRTFVTVNLSPELPGSSQAGFIPRVRAFLHFSGYLAARAGAIDLTNYQGWTDHFPLRWRPEANPIRYVPTPPAAGIDEVLAFMKRPELATVDYVLVWSLHSGEGGEKTWAKIEKELDPTFSKVVESGPNGWARLYRNRGPGRFVAPTEEEF